MANIIQSELKNRNVPDVLLTKNGQVVKTKEQWEKEQRPYWKEIILENEYGKIPPKVTPEISIKKNSITFANKAVWETVSFTFNHNGKSHTVPTQLIYPVGAKDIPFFVYLNFRPDIPDRYLPVEEIIDNGFGIFAVCRDDITKDNASFESGIAKLFNVRDRRHDDTGKIMYWAYMASAMMDYLQTRVEADKSKIGVCGHSRLGKTALLAAALDERFAFSCSNDSGCSGAALSRGHCEGAEHIKDILDNVDYWFCPNYFKYYEKENELPFDQHCLIAMIAPRNVYVGGAIEDVWADNDNQFLACVAASKVWELYDKKGLITPDKLPVCGDVLTDGEVGFHLRAGSHYHSRTDWLVYMDAVKKAFK